jgi:hypothetical protein
LQACENEQSLTVQHYLTQAFERYGLLERMSMDNGAPWGSGPAYAYTALTAWLIRLGIRVSHSRPYHPQTQGKDERFHRTLQAEVLQGQLFEDIAHCQKRFDQWRWIYNSQRPHQALNMACPSSRYQPSPRVFPNKLPSIEYAPDDIVRQVRKDGLIQYRGKTFKACSQAFRGYPVALRPTVEDGVYEVYFCHQKVNCINLKQGETLG